MGPGASLPISGLPGENPDLDRIHVTAASGFTGTRRATGRPALAIGCTP